MTTTMAVFVGYLAILVGLASNGRGDSNRATVEA